MNRFLAFASRHLFLATCLLLAAAYPAAAAAPTIVHQPPLDAREGRPVLISAMVTDAAVQVLQVRLFYRSGGALGYQMQILNGAGYNYSGQVPGEAVTAAGVDYYLEAQNRNGETSSSPPMNSALAPYHLVSRAAAPAPGLRLLSPENGSVVAPDEAVVVVALENGASRVDLSTLAILFDEQNVTAKSQISETLISFVPPDSISAGVHTVRMRVRNADGSEAESPAWSFTVRRAGKIGEPAAVPREQGTRFNGGLTLENQYAGVTPDDTQTLYTNQPRGWMNRLNLNLSGKSGGLNMLGSAFLTSEDKPGRQPADRMRLELFDETFNLALGEVYPQFSPYSLSNPFLRGGSLMLSAGRADSARSQLMVVGGLTRLPIEGRDLTAPGTFEQWLWGVRWNYAFLADTGFALNYATVNDYANSLAQPGGSQPADNHVLTAEAKAKIPWQADLATSVFGEYGLSYYDNQQNLLAVSLGSAYRGGLRCDWGGRSYAQVEFKNTGADYVSLANPWLIGDWRGFSGDAQVYLLDNTLSLLANGNYWHDNLNGQKTQTYISSAGTTVTAGTTTTTFLSSAVHYRVTSWLPSLSLGYSLNRQQDDTWPDTLVDNLTLVFNLGLGGQFSVGADQLLATLTWSQTQYSDLAPTKLSANLESSSFLTSLMFLAGPQWSVSCGLGLTGSRTDASALSSSAGTTTTANQAITYALGNVRAVWKVVPGQWDASAGWEVLAGRDDQQLVDNNLTTASLGGMYYPAPAQSLSLNLARIQSTDRITAANSYAEFVANLKYGINF